MVSAKRDKQQCALRASVAAGDSRWEWQLFGPYCFGEGMGDVIFGELSLS